MMNMNCMSGGMKNKKACLIAIGAVGTAVAVGVGSWMIYHSRQMRLMRTAKRTGKILYKMGNVLQAASGVAEDF